MKLNQGLGQYMKNLFIFLTALFHGLTFAPIAKASFPEMFGASSSTMAVGGQARAHTEDASNNYYAPALLGFSKQLQLQASTFWAQTDFDEVGSITVENDWTRLECSYPNCKSTVDVNPEPLWLNALHLSVPILNVDGPKLGISAFVPAKSIMEVRSGDPILPEYVMYSGRNSRAQVFGNLAYAFSPNFSASVGVYNGFQVAVDVNAYARVGADKTAYSTFARSEAVAKPTLAGIGSVAYRAESWSSYFTIIQEMKSKLSGKATGQSDDPKIPFAIQVNSLAFYDPLTLRLGWQGHMGSWALNTAVEWQRWDHYQPPIAHIKQEGGVIVSSKILEELDLQNIFVPKIGLEWNVTDPLALRLGVSHRPSPLKGNFSGAGNSVDSDILSFSGGGGLKQKIWGKDFEGQLGLEYQKLETRNVSKSANREDGGAGEKVGAPGYKVGGKVLVASLGLAAHF